MWRVIGAGLCLLVALGCAGRTTSATDARKGGVKVNAPGVEVDVEPGGKTDVKAPGVNVEARPPKTTKRD